jgi:uncharacterized protein (TIGR00304 family)
MVVCIRDLLVMGLVGVLIVVLGIGISLVGFLLMLFGALLSGEEDRENRVEGGGVLIIGPIPIVFGTSRRIEVTINRATSRERINRTPPAGPEPKQSGTKNRTTQNPVDTLVADAEDSKIASKTPTIDIAIPATKSRKPMRVRLLIPSPRG